jgi:hypothetical protein
MTNQITTEARIGLLVLHRSSHLRVTPCFHLWPSSFVCNCRSALGPVKVSEPYPFHFSCSAFTPRIRFLNRELESAATCYRVIMSAPVVIVLEHRSFI